MKERKGVKINAFPVIFGILAKVAQILGLVGLMSCVDDMCPILPVGFGISGKSLAVIKETKKRVLQLASNQKVQQVVIRLGKTKDELLSAMRTPGGNPLRWTLNNSNTLTRDLGDYIEVTTNLGRGSRFQSKISKNGEHIVILEAFKERITDKLFHASNLFIDQYKFIGKGTYSNINKVTIDTVENIDTVNKIRKGISFSETTFGKMVNYMAQSSGKTIASVDIGNISSFHNKKGELQYVIDKIDIFYK